MILELLGDLLGDPVRRAAVRTSRPIQTVYPRCVLPCGLGDLVRVNTSGLCDELPNVRHPRRLVALSTEGHRGQIRRVGLYHHRLQRADHCRRSNVRSFWEGHDAGERQNESTFEARFGLNRATGEAVHDRGRWARRPVQDLKGVLPRIAGVDDEGKVKIGGQVDLLGKDDLLDLAIGVFVLG